LDDCKGVSENIMLGQLAPIGTGDFGVVLDEEALKNAPIQPELMMAPGMGAFAGGMTPLHTPYFDRAPSPMSQGGYSPVGAVQFSPIGAGTSVAKPWLGSQSPIYGAASPGFGGSASPNYSPVLPF
jgi:DNA-directed RNA polymerase II subunit RPB1